MKHDSVRWSLIFALAFVAVQCHCASGEPLTTTESLRMISNAVEEKARAIRENVKVEYENVDRSCLLNKKEAVDSFLLPVFAMLEIGRANPLEICGHFRFGYGEDERLLVVADAITSRSLRRSLSSFRLTNNEALVFDLEMERTVYNGADYPLVLSGEAQVTSTSFSLRLDWYEPYLSNRNLGFPAHPEDLYLEYDSEKFVIECNETNADPIARMCEAAYPTFNNPWDLYDLYDSVKIWPFLSQGIDTSNKSVSELERSPRDCITTYSGDAGRRRIRSTHLTWRGEDLSEIRVDQPAIFLRHISDATYQIRKEVEGKVLQLEEYCPGVRIPYLTSGRVLILRFGKPETIQDPLKVVPLSLTIESQGRTLFSCHFRNFKKTSAAKSLRREQGDKELAEVRTRSRRIYAALAGDDMSGLGDDYYTLDDLTRYPSPLMARKYLKFNAFLAILRHDQRSLEESLEEYRQLLDATGVSQRCRVFSVEALAQMAYEFVDRESGDMVVRSVLSEAYRECQTSELQYHICRLIDQCRLGFAWVALAELAETAQYDPSTEQWRRRVEDRILVFVNGKQDLREWRAFPDYERQMRVSRQIYGSLKGAR